MTALNWRPSPDINSRDRATAVPTAEDRSSLPPDLPARNGMQHGYRIRTQGEPIGAQIPARNESQRSGV